MNYERESMRTEGALRSNASGLIDHDSDMRSIYDTSHNTTLLTYRYTKAVVKIIWYTTCRSYWYW